VAKRVANGTGCARECLGPDSNRHGVAPEGFSYPLQLSLLRAPRAFGVWTLSLPCRDRVRRLRFRQGPSSLYTFPETLMKQPKFTRDQIVAAVDGASSLRQVLIRLNVAPYGGNYGVLRRALNRHNIDTSQFTGRSWSRGVRLSPRKPLTAYLENTAPIQSYKLKRRLLRERLFESSCTGCGLTQWQGVPIPLELDHVNGNNGRQQAGEPAASVSQLPRADSDLSQQAPIGA
jgi:hypothetical protein